MIEYPRARLMIATFSYMDFMKDFRDFITYYTSMRCFIGTYSKNSHLPLKNLNDFLRIFIAYEQLGGSKRCCIKSRYSCLQSWPPERTLTRPSKDAWHFKQFL